MFLNMRIIRWNMFYGAEPKTLRAASILRRNMTLAEKVLWKKLSDRKIFKAKFRKQHPIWIFIVDFYCHEYKLVIEVDGDVHEEDEVNEYDLGRTAELNRFGLKVIRFTNDEILFNMDFVISEIQKTITEFTPL
jgi:very-short-patch-repair endonuclease